MYQFSKHAGYPRTLTFLSFTVLCKIPKWLSFMVLASSKTSDEFRPPQQQGMLTLTSHREEPDDSSAHRFHYAIASNGTE
jgi:hypothetical protein